MVWMVEAEGLETKGAAKGGLYLEKGLRSRNSQTGP